MRYYVVFLMLSLSVVLQGAAPSSGEKKSTSEQEFCRLDKNNDRSITFEEFAACEFYKLEHVRTLPFARSQDVAPGKGGALSDDELKATLFKKADTNRDNKIDRKEWEEFYRSVVDQGLGETPGPYDKR